MSEVQRVPEDDLEFDSDQVFTHDAEPFTGIAYDESAVGRSEVSYRDGLQDGPSRDWFPSGALRSEMMYVRGARHGVSRAYDEHGHLSSETWFEYDICTLRKRYGKDGTLDGVDEIDMSAATGHLLARYRAEYGWEPPDPVDS